MLAVVAAASRSASAPEVQIIATVHGKTVGVISTGATERDTYGMCVSWPLSADESENHLGLFARRVL